MNESRISAPLLICVFAAAVGLLAFPQYVSRAVSDAFSLCTDTLLPTLFPFMILSGIVIRSGLACRLGRRAHRFMASVFHLPGVCFLPLLLGMIGGYPTGAKTVINLYHSGSCSQDEAEHTLAFCNNCGPGFLISTVGLGLFGDIRYGVLLYAAHITAGLLTGVLLAPRRKPIARCYPGPSQSPVSASMAFVGSVTDALQAFLNLCSFVLCFSAIVSLVQLSGIPAVLSGVFPIFGSNGQWFLLGLLEMTGGIRNLNSGTLSEQLTLCAALAAWGGFSVHCQVLYFLQDTDLSPRLYWRGKALHALLSALLINTTVLPISFPYFTASITLIFAILCLCKKSSGNRKESVL